MRRSLRFLSCLWLFCAVSGRAGEALDFTFFVNRLTDLDHLPYIVPGETSKQFSSYDRSSRLGPGGEKINWGANADVGQYLRVEPGGEAVMAEMEGPGVITQAWSANPQGKLHFYIDDAAAPIVFDFAAFTTGGIPEIPPAVSTKGGGAGVNCYLPIPYAKRCAIKADKAHVQYYHFNYTTFPAGTRVASFAWPLADAEKAALAKAAAWLDTRCGEDPAPRPGAATIRKEIALAGGATATVAAIEGPGIITKLRLKLAGTGRTFRRDVLLRAYWDGAEKPAVEAPYGDFFASAWADVPFRSLPIGMTAEGGYCLWRMPFASSARIELVNEGAAEVEAAAEVVWARAEWKENAAYFHAKWRREAPNKTFDWPLLRCEGRGRYVGVAMNVQNPDPPWFGEGDEKVYVDGETFPSWFGTGTEDYFCDAWGFRPFIQFSHGCPMYNEPGKTTVYRWHTLDNIPFAKSFEITIENYGDNKDYSSTAYWYAAPQNRDFFGMPPAAERIPWPVRIPYAIEAEDAAAPGATVIGEAATPYELSAGKALALAAGGAPAVLRIPIKADDAYRITFYGPKGQKGAGLKVRMRGTTLAAAPAPAFAGDGAIVCPARTLLRKGTVELECAAEGEGDPVLFDAVRLDPSPRVPHALEAESLAAATSPGARADVLHVLTNDAVSGCAALALRCPAGGWVQLALPAQLDGRFKVSARLLPHGRGSFDVACGAARLGAVDTDKEDVQLGTAVLAGGEANALRFTCTRAPAGEQAVLAIDYFALTPVIAEGAIEIEALKLLRQENANAQHQALGHALSGGLQLFCPGQRGQFVELLLPVEEAGEYALVIYFTKAADYGIVTVEIDGTAIGERFNGFNNGVVPSGGIGFGTAALAKGDHVLAFRCRDKDPRSINYFMGIDCLTLARR